MKPAPFDYCCPDSVEEVLERMALHGDEAKIMAGGQSLTPMLNFRVVRPALIIDISRLLDLDVLTEQPESGLQIGALTRHRVLETSPTVASRFPVIPEAMRHVAHLAIRNRGTIGGSLAHADPAAELPMLVKLLDAAIVARSVRGQRTVPAGDFFVGPLTTALEPDELLVRVDVPGCGPHGWGFEEFSRRAGDFALAAAGVLLQVTDDRVVRARVAMMGVGDTPLHCAEAETALIGTRLSDSVIAHVVQAACDPLTPRQDLQATADYRRHLAGVLLERALRRAWTRATNPAQATP